MEKCEKTIPWEKSGMYAKFGDSLLHDADIKGIKLASFMDLQRLVLEAKDPLHVFNYKGIYIPYADTIDAIVNHPNGEVLLWLNSTELFRVSKDSRVKEILSSEKKRKYPALSPGTDHPQKGYIAGKGWFLKENKEESYEFFNQLKKRSDVLVLSKRDIEANGISRTYPEAISFEPFKFLARNKDIHKDYIKLVYSLLEKTDVRFALPLYAGKTLTDKVEISAVRLSSILPCRSYVMKGGNDKNQGYNFVTLENPYHSNNKKLVKNIPGLVEAGLEKCKGYLLSYSPCFPFLKVSSSKII